MQRVGGRSFETESIVEAVGVLVGMGHHGPRSDDLGGGCAAKQGVLQQRRADSLPLIPVVHGQAGDQQNRDRAPGRLPPEQSLGGVLGFDLPDCQGVIADQPGPIRRDEGPGRSGGLRLTGVPTEPVVQCLFAAAEAVDAVLPPDGLRPRKRHGSRRGRLLENARLRKQVPQSGRDARGAVQQGVELTPSDGIELELGPVCKDAAGLRHGSSSNEAAVARFGELARSSDDLVLGVLDAKVPAALSGLPGPRCHTT